LERLEKHPELEERFELIMDIVENAIARRSASSAFSTSAEAVRQLGNENRARLGAASTGEERKRV